MNFKNQTLSNLRINSTLCNIVILLIALLSTTASADPHPINPSVILPVMPENNQQTKYDSKNPHQSTQKFKQYLKDKYKNITEANSRVRHTSHGLSGDIFVIGDIEALRKPDLSTAKDKHARSRIIAKSFMEDEATLFGIVNPDEIREYNILDSTGINGDYTIIYYRRYINDVEFKNSELDIEVGQNENIKSFSARLDTVPLEVYVATKMNTLSENEIKTIVEADLFADNKSGYDKLKKVESDSHGHDSIQLKRSFKKIAVTTSPYIIWEVSYLRYIYTIDAFTGKILNKINSRIPLVPAIKPTSTDQNYQGDTPPPMPPPILPQK